MAFDRNALPQLGSELFLTDGGIETCLIFHEGLDLPLFAAFDLLGQEAGTEALRRYYRPYLELARDVGTGFVFESPTWRASRDWGERLQPRRSTSRDTTRDPSTPPYRDAACRLEASSRHEPCG